MLRQRRFSQRTSIGQSLNLYANENFMFLSSMHGAATNGFAHNEAKLPHSYKRVGLSQVDKNSNKYLQISDTACFSKTGNYQSKDRYDPGSKNRQNQALFGRISELIKHEENGVPTCHSQKNKRLVRRKDRPYTSLSNCNRISQNRSSFGKFHVVLDLTPKEESQQTQDPSKSSTSRALMNYSKVYRNSSGDRFKVKRDKGYMNHFALVSAQRMVLQDKEKKEKKQVQMPLQKPPSRQKSRWQGSKIATRKRYAAEQEEFQIDGWEYFD